MFHALKSEVKPELYATSYNSESCGGEVLFLSCNRSCPLIFEKYTTTTTLYHTKTHCHVTDHFWRFLPWGEGRPYISNLPQGFPVWVFIVRVISLVVIGWGKVIIPSSVAFTINSCNNRRNYYCIRNATYQIV